MKNNLIQNLDWVKKIKEKYVNNIEDIIHNYNNLFIYIIILSLNLIFLYFIKLSFIVVLIGYFIFIYYI